MIAAFVTGVLAIRFMLGYLRTRSLTIFVVYRLVVAAVVVVALLR
jgi:undecaprenyl pyrophosphate phosphatase UppP